MSARSAWLGKLTMFVGRWGGTSEKAANTNAVTASMPAPEPVALEQRAREMAPTLPEVPMARKKARPSGFYARPGLSPLRRRANDRWAWRTGL